MEFPYDQGDIRYIGCGWCQLRHDADIPCPMGCDDDDENEEENY